MNENRLLTLLFLMSFAIYVLSSFIFPIKWWDETVYANLGWDLKSGKNYSFEGKWSDFDPDWPKAGYRAPLLPFIIAMLYAAFGRNEFILNLLMPFFGSIGVIFLYLLAKEMFNKKNCSLFVLFSCSSASLYFI